MHGVLSQAACFQVHGTLCVKSPNLMPLALRVVGRSEYFASGSGEHFWRSLSAVLMDAAPVLATQKRSDRPPEDPGGPCRAWIESDVKGGSYKHFQVSDPIVYWTPALAVQRAFPSYSDHLQGLDHA